MGSVSDRWRWRYGESMRLSGRSVQDAGPDGLSVIGVEEHRGRGRKSGIRACEEPDCLTLTTVQTLTLKLGSHQDCDSLGEALDGLIEVRDFVHVYDSNGNERGFHSGRFRWESDLGLIFGELSGITNAGTHSRGRPRLPLPVLIQTA